MPFHPPGNILPLKGTRTWLQWAHFKGQIHFSQPQYQHVLSFPKQIVAKKLKKENIKKQWLCHQKKTA